MPVSRKFLIEIKTTVIAQTLVMNEGDTEVKSIALPVEATESEIQRNSPFSGLSKKVGQLIKRRYQYPFSVSQKILIPDNGQEYRDVKITLLVESTYEDSIEEAEINCIFDSLQNSVTDDFKFATEKAIPVLMEAEGDEHGKVPSAELLGLVPGEHERPSDRVSVVDFVRRLVDKKTGGELNFKIGETELETVFVPPQASTVKEVQDQSLVLRAISASKTLAKCSRPDLDNQFLTVNFADPFKHFFDFAAHFKCAVYVTGRYSVTYDAGTAKRNLNLREPPLLFDQGNFSEFNAFINDRNYLEPVSVARLNEWLLPKCDDSSELVEEPIL